MDFVTLSQYDADRLIQYPPLSDPVSLTAKYVGTTSTLSHYEWIERFTTVFPHRIQELPDAAFGLLILESNDPCDCDKRECDKPHFRTWSSNIGTINRFGKNHLIAEFRVIAHGVSKKLLSISAELTKLEQVLGGLLPGVRKIFFLGQGLVDAGSENMEASNADSANAVQAIYRIFPGTTDVTYHPHAGWGISPGYTKLPLTPCKLVGMTISAYFQQLQSLQLHLTTPLTFQTFCRELTSLSINVEHIRPHTHLPPVPIGCMRALHLMRIDGVIPWSLFEVVDGKLDFANLTELTMGFIIYFEDKVSFPSYRHLVHMPALAILRVFQSTCVYHNIFSYFVSNRLGKLIVMDDPLVLGHIDWQVLQNVQQLEVRHPTGEFFETKYPSAAVQQLFTQPSSVTEVSMIGKVYYPMPINLQWHGLVSLELAVAIADKDTLTNLLAQLLRLERLHISCRSMDRGEGNLTVYTDEKDAPAGLQARADFDATDGEGFGAVNLTLRRFDFYSRLAFDIHGFCQLLCRLPNLWSCAINSGRISSVEQLLDGYYNRLSKIIIEPYPEPLDFAL